VLTNHFLITCSAPQAIHYDVTVAFHRWAGPPPLLLLLLLLLGHRGCCCCCWGLPRCRAEVGQQLGGATAPRRADFIL
jgi:hypothetical protein